MLKFLAKVKRAWNNRKYSLLGIETIKIVPTNKLKVDDSESYANASQYGPISKDCFDTLLNSVKWPWAASTFVDYGCGKGAAIIYASERNFSSYIGIEFSKLVYDVGVKNMDRIAKFRPQLKGRIHLYNVDARIYEIPSHANVFYFYSPFDATLTEAVVQNMIKSQNEFPREILVLFNDCRIEEVFTGNGFEICSRLKEGEGVIDKAMAFVRK